MRQKETCTSHMDMNSSWTYIQSVCGEADLRHLHVERALVIAQSACRRTETAGQYSYSHVSLHISSLPSSPSQDLM